ncbi:uncharacterized protein MYCGRDRAFT_92862 [Zymoseptoria tritici IPO323]|uniref:Uncharacterized protein n=1 Tax=Zymoseptoria tritici (strain CBS 115943 / IPO323) TaxID=336722 RepID=F9X8P3_ZYMTI|nr:uncharacterized protein MYCGRDRAFT_92862 [Zymoseptoria tritici IPO323]EGP88124.1 hypothetical protein MYCGRDRAFT_92862 [Zymoseptoria tritici IPO323]
MQRSPVIGKDCPFPEVADSLEPFIKTRQETNAIRQGLQSTLPLSTIHVSQPLPSEDIKPARLIGVRRAYYRALQAHNAAQAKYAAVKEELAQLSAAGEHDAPKEADAGSNFLTDSYIPLIRQREKHRKLLVIDKALTKVTQVGSEAITESFDTVAQREVGELPGLPSASLSADREDSEYDLLRLKKAILSTRQQISEHEKHSARAKKQIEGRGMKVDGKADLKALQKTHMALTMWMESQLGLIGDVEAPTPKAADTTGNANSAPEFTIRDIEELYETYLSARTRLLQLVAHPPAPGPPPPPPFINSRAQNPSDATNDQHPLLTPSILALPYLHPLLTAHTTTSSLTQQTSHVRRSLAQSEFRTQELLGRLADESHLLPPDLSRSGSGVGGKAWRDAGRAAGVKTREVALGRVRAGLGFVEMAEGVVGEIEGMERGGSSG